MSEPIKLHAGDQRAARLLSALESTVIQYGNGMPMPTILGIIEILKDLVKGMDCHD